MARKRKKMVKAKPVTPAVKPMVADKVENNPAAQSSGPVDTKPMVAAVEKNVPPNLLPAFKMIVLKGDAQMFGENTHKLMLEQLDKPGPMGPKLAEGIVALIYILFQKSNKTLPPQLLEPAGTVLLLHAFDFLQEAHHPEATRETLGDAADKFRVGIHNALGVTESQFNEAMAKHGQGMQGAQP